MVKNYQQEFYKRQIEAEKKKQKQEEILITARRAKSEQTAAYNRRIGVRLSRGFGTAIQGVARTRGQIISTARAIQRSPFKRSKSDTAEFRRIKAQIQLEKLRQKAAGVRGRGRPVGSYAPEYQQFGGVYNARKVVAQQRALERAEAMRQATISPEQQQIINQFEAQRRARMGTPFGWESVSVSNDIKKEVSSTSLGSLQDEIDKACNEVP